MTFVLLNIALYFRYDVLVWFCEYSKYHWVQNPIQMLGKW